MGRAERTTRCESHRVSVPLMEAAAAAVGELGHVLPPTRYWVGTLRGWMTWVCPRTLLLVAVVTRRMPRHGAPRLATTRAAPVVVVVVGGGAGRLVTRSRGCWRVPGWLDGPRSLWAVLLVLHSIPCLTA